jgi:phosphoesterase RecJ-like protein
MGLQAPPSELIVFFDQHPGFYIVAHEEPDGDSTGSQLVLGSFLERRGKKVVLLSPGPWQRKEIASYERFFRKNLSKEEVDPRFGVILLDCASLDRIGSFKEVLSGLNTAVIDHHASNGGSFGSLQYIEPKAPCVTLLIQKIIETCREPLTTEEARLLFLGFATDTGFFRHLEVEAAESLELVSRLAARGVTPKSIYQETFGNYSLASRKYLAAILSTLETHFDGKLLVTHITFQDFQTYPKDYRQSDPLYQLLLSVEGCEVVVFIREEEPGKTSVSLRSPRGVNVAEIAQKFGGGGHKNAAGYITPLSWNDAKEQLLEIFRPLFYPSVP